MMDKETFNKIFSEEINKKVPEEVISKFIDEANVGAEDVKSIKDLPNFFTNEIVSAISIYDRQKNYQIRKLLERLFTEDSNQHD